MPSTSSQMALRNCPWQRLVGVWRTDASPSHFQEFMKRHVSGGYLYDASDADVADVIDSNLVSLGRAELEVWSLT